MAIQWSLISDGKQIWVTTKRKGSNLIPASNSHWRKTLCVLIPALVFTCLIVLTLSQQSPVWMPLDDAYITIGNVDLFLSGRSDLYGNDGPTGASSLVHFLVLAFLSQFTTTPEASLALSVLSAGAYMIGLWLLLCSVSGSRIVAASGSIAGLLLGFAWLHLMNGLETGMAMAAITWAFFLRQTNRHVALSILIGIMPFIRPEFYVLSALLFISIIVVKPINYAYCVKIFFISASAYIILALVSVLILGSVWPDTAGAKEAFFAEKGEVFSSRLMVALRAVVETNLLVVFSGLVFAPFLRGGWVALAFFGIFVLSSALKLPGALYHNDFRYLYPLLPIAIASWTAVLTARQVSSAPVFVIGALLSVYAFATSSWPVYTIQWKSGSEERLITAEWMTENLPSNSVVGVHDAGFIPWKIASTVSNQNIRFVDLVGLKSPSAIKFHEEFTAPSNGKERWRAFDVLGRERKIDYIIVLDRPFWRRIEDSFKTAGWDINLIFANEGGYQVFSANPN